MRESRLSIVTPSRATGAAEIGAEFATGGAGAAGVEPLHPHNTMAAPVTRILIRIGAPPGTSAGDTGPRRSTRCLAASDARSIRAGEIATVSISYRGKNDTG